ncbi:MAG: pilus assembly protein PilM [Candidatus Peregrinibacteria bacterium]|nr:pilus assembly protein PilM [Candidatus Peregrinibacteria bacterium]MCB9808258.1 pilus assembly protein PilM [Candidatus Peribacteria bacterium]
MFALQCSPSVIRAAAAKRSGSNLAVHARAEKKISGDIFQAGGIADTEKALEALQELMKMLKIKRGAVTLCVSPRMLYTTLIRVPKTRRQLAAAVRGELEAVLPVPIETMDVHFTQVRHDEQGLRIAITAVSKDAFGTYQSLLKDAGLTLKGVTTTGLALGNMVKEDSFLLINAEDPEPSIVVFYGGKPVDEHLLSSVAVKNVLSDTKALLDEYAADGMPIQHIAVHGTKELSEKVEDAFTPKKSPKDKREEIEQATTVERLLPNLAKSDLEWGGVIISSLGRGIDIRKGFSRGTMLQYVLMLTFFTAAAYFFWIVGSQQILGIWSDLTSL